MNYKVRNNKEVLKGVRNFSYYLIATVALAVAIFSAFMKTSSVEIDHILEKTQEYDYIQMRQIALTESMDTLYFYTSLLNTDKKINTSLMFNVISERKNKFLSQTEKLLNKDCLIYKKLAVQMNVFLSVKDSIHISTREEDLLRADLLRCISDNRQAARNISIGGLSHNK